MCLIINMATTSALYGKTGSATKCVLRLLGRGVLRMLAPQLGHKHPSGVTNYGGHQIWNPEQQSTKLRTNAVSSRAKSLSTRGSDIRVTSSRRPAGSKGATGRMGQARALRGARRRDVLLVLMLSRIVRNPKSSSILHFSQFLNPKSSSIPQFLKITTDPQRHRARLFTSKITYCAGGSGQSKYCAGGWPVRPIEQCRLLPLSNVLRIRLQGC